MNKLLIILLAVCLVSVHAFVKREAEAPKEGNLLDNVLKLFEESARDANTKMQTALSPENMQKGFTDFVEGMRKSFNDLKSKTASPQ